MPPQFAPELKDIDRTDLAAMSREELEDLAWRLHELARALANRAGEEAPGPVRARRRATTPIDVTGEALGARIGPEGGGEAETSPAAPGKAASRTRWTAKPAGKRPGEKGCWRSRPISCERRSRAHADRVLPLWSRPRSRAGAPLRQRP